MTKEKRRQLLFFSSRGRVLLPRWPGSASCFVFAAAAVAGLSAVVAGPQRWVAAHAGRYDGQAEQGQPAHAELLVAGVTRARVRVVALGVGHAVVEHALGTQHAAHLVNALLDWIGGILALPEPVFLVVEYLSAIYATGALAVFPPPPGLLGFQQR